MSTITKGNLERGKVYHLRFDGSWINEMLGNIFFSDDGRRWFLSHVQDDTLIMIEEEIVYEPESGYLH